MPWIASRAELNLHPGLAGIECVDASGRIAGMVAYDGWMPGACQIHVALDSPIAARRLLKDAFSIPFTRMHLAAVIAPVSSGNAASIRLVEKLGFRLVHRGKGYLGSNDLCFYEMRREECRWIGRA